MKLTRARIISLFLLITLVGCWAPVLWVYLTDRSWVGPLGRAISLWQAFPPLLAALVVQGPVLKQPVLEPLGLSFKINRWWLIAWVMPVCVLAIGLLLLAIVGEDLVLSTEELLANKRSLVPPEELDAFDSYVEENPPQHPLWLVPMGMPAGLTINMLLALGEEVGLRGFLFREIPGGFWKRSFWIAIVWALMWAPSVGLGHLYPNHPLQGFGLVFLWCAAASPVFVYLRVRSGSVIATSIARGTMMALGGAAVDLSFTASDLARPFYGWTGILALLVILGAFWLHDRYGAHQRLMSH